MTLGHETSGDIVAVGKNVTDRKVGDRVSCESHIPCGSCYFCTHGMPHICKDIQLFGCTQNGAFAEYAAIRSDCTFLLPDDVSYEAACMFEPMGAGVHGVEAAQVEGKTVLVSGCGPIGMTAISACKTFGATKVFACDLLDSRLAIAKDMGADYVFNSAQVDLPAEILRLTDGLGADAAIDITGAQAAINADLKCLRAAGRMVCVGLPSGPVTLQDMTDEKVKQKMPCFFNKLFCVILYILGSTKRPPAKVPPVAYALSCYFRVLCVRFSLKYERTGAARPPPPSTRPAPCSHSARLKPSLGSCSSRFGFA